MDNEQNNSEDSEFIPTEVLRESHLLHEQVDAEPREAYAGDKEQHSQDDSPVSVSSPIIIGQVEASNTEDGAYSRQNETNQPKQNNDRWMTRFTGLIFFVTAVYAVTSIFQYYSVKRQADLMDKQLTSMNQSSAQTQQMIDAAQKTAEQNRLLAETTQRMAEQNKELVGYTGELAKASIVQAETAKRSIGLAQTSARAAEQSVQIARESFYIGDRPYVTAGYSSIENFEAGVKPRIFVAFSNTGKTPALEVRAAGKITIGATPSPEESTNDDTIIIEPTISTLPAGSKFTLPAGEKMGLYVEGREVLTESNVEEIKNGKIFLFVWGVAFYEDGLGKPHELRYCMFYSPADDIFIACTEFNSTN